MRPKIRTSNIKYYIRQEYGFKSTSQFFELTELHPKLRNQVIAKVVAQFTGYTLMEGKLQTYNPYTGKSEALNIKNFNHITTEEELMKDLSMLHKTRMKMLEQSRKRILELAKTKTPERDKDLKVTIENTQTKRNERLHQMNAQDQNRNREEELER